MASVIRNPVIIHCLDQFGITPAEMRAIDQTSPRQVPQSATHFGDWTAQLVDTFLNTPPSPPRR